MYICAEYQISCGGPYVDYGFMRNKYLSTGLPRVYLEFSKGVSYTIAIKLSIFLYDPDFRSNENNLSFGFYSTCTLVFWLPNLDKFE